MNLPYGILIITYITIVKYSFFLKYMYCNTEPGIYLFIESAHGFYGSKGRIKESSPCKHIYKFFSFVITSTYTQITCIFFKSNGRNLTQILYNTESVNPFFFVA